jgi:hypothetical protein
MHVISERGFWPAGHRAVAGLLAPSPRKSGVVPHFESAQGESRSNLATGRCRPPGRGRLPGRRSSLTKPELTINMLMLHGVRSCLEYERTLSSFPCKASSVSSSAGRPCRCWPTCYSDLAAARAQRNPDLSPHLAFLDMGGHGYSLVHATREWLEVECVCIPRPIRRSAERDGGPFAISRRTPRTTLGERRGAPSRATPHRG